MTSVVSFEYSFVSHFVIRVKLVLKKKNSKFSKKRASWNSFIVSADNKASVLMFDSLPLAIHVVLKQSDIATAKLFRVIESV